MSPVRVALAVLTLACGAVLPASGPSRADWKILYYDDNGRLVGVEGSATKGRAGAGEAAGAGTAGSLERGALPPDQRYEDGEIIVSDPPRGFDLAVRQLGFGVVEQVSLRNLSVDLFRLRVPRGSSVPAAVTQLRRQFPGLVIDANHLFDPSAGRTPEVFARAVMGWGATPADCGRGVRIGAIDGAVDVKHPALQGRNLDYRSFHAPDRRPAAIDHGTAIAAMLIGQAPWGGLLPAAELKHVNIFELNANGQVSANTYALLKAVDWVAGERVHVINLSVAGSSNQVLDQVLRKARKKGFILVGAAGNGGPDAPPAYPAAYDYVIAVTAVDVNQALYAHANRGAYVDFAAPGVAIWTAVPGGGRAQSGTSFAAPYVSVLIGLDVARGLVKDPRAARARLRSDALDLGSPGRDDLFGLGLVRQPRDCSALAAG